MRPPTSSLVKLAAFCTAGLLSGVLVVNTLSQPVRGDTVTYRAEFTSVEGLNVGNPVTMNGIRIGRVDTIDFAGNGNGTSRADVAIEVTSDVALTVDVTAAVRYGDMLGARYVALSEPGGSVIPLSTNAAPTLLSAGAVIPLTQTTPAVDLTALLNGFKPLFDALEPEQVNTLTRGFVETFAGQTQTLVTLMAQIAAMTSSMTDHSDTYATLITNVKTLMAAVDSQQPQLEEMLAGLQRMAQSLTESGGQLDLLVDQGNAVLATLSAAVTRTGVEYGDTITNLNSMLTAWGPQTPEFERLLTELPEFGDAINRASGYGGYVSLYLCNFTLKIASHEANIFGRRHSEVCL